MGPPTDTTRYDRWVARTSGLLDRLALVFLVVFLVQWLYINPPDLINNLLDACQLAIWAAFAVDYVTRLALVTGKWHFITTHKLDLLMVLLPMLRMLRVVLLLRKSLRSHLDGADRWLAVHDRRRRGGQRRRARVEHRAPAARRQHPDHR